MIRISSAVTLALLLGVMQGCSEGNESAQTNNAETGAAQTTSDSLAKLKARVEASAAEDIDAAAVCDLLSDELLRSHFDIGADTEIERRPSDYSPHPLCTVNWERPNAEEIKQDYQAALNEYIKKRARGEKIKMPMLDNINEVSLTLYAPLADSSEQARVNFDSAMNMLSKGVTAKTGDAEVTFQADITPINGLGDKAMWAARMNQVSVLDGRRIFHLVVKVGDKETNKTGATTLAVNLTQLL